MKFVRRPILVDIGYGPMEHIVQAIAVNSRTCKGLFDDTETVDLLAELPGGERIWVSYWTEIN